MLWYTLRRIAYILPILVGVSIVCFSFVHLAPGDPMTAVMPDFASPELIAQIKGAYGFDRPLPIQYFRWLRAGVCGRPILAGSLPTERSPALQLWAYPYRPTG